MQSKNKNETICKNYDTNGMMVKKNMNLFYGEFY